MAKLLMAPLNTKWRLDGDWAVPDVLLKSYGNNELIRNLVGQSVEIRDWPEYDTRVRGVNDSSWVEGYHEWEDALIAAADCVVPTGTVISINRYHVSNSGKEEITCQFHASPRASLAPKKRGGKMFGKGLFYLTLNQFNDLPEMTNVPD